MDNKGWIGNAMSGKHDTKMSLDEAARFLRSQPGHIFRVEDVYWDDDVVRAGLRFARSEEYRWVAAQAEERGFHPPAEVVDLGAGRGIASLAWALRGYSVTAVEPDPSDLLGTGAVRALVSRTGVPIAVRNDVGEHMGLRSASVDIVYVRQALHHAASLDAMCHEIARILRPGGLLIATREHVVSDRGELELFWDCHPVHRLAGGEMAYPVKEYLRALRSAGFVRIRTYGRWETPVNYFPDVASGEVAQLCTGAATKWFGPALGRWLSRQPQFQRVWGKHLSHKDRLPGRMYSFICRRAGG